MWQIAGILIVIFAVMVYVNKRMKKIKSKQYSENGTIQVLDTLQLGMNQNVTMIQIGNEIFLLANGPGGNSLVKMEQTEVAANRKENFEEIFKFGNSPEALKNVAMEVVSKLRGKMQR